MTGCRGWRRTSSGAKWRSSSQPEATLRHWPPKRRPRPSQSCSPAKTLRAGLVASLNHPGGNITGVNLMTGEAGSKRLGLLRELVPKAATIAVLFNPNSPGTENHLPDVQSAARSLGLQIRVLNVTDQGEIDAAFGTLARERPDALLVNPDPFMNSRREQIVTLANHYRLPALYELREFVEAGGLMSYGPSHTEPSRLIGIYTGRILKGAKPAELPVIQSTKFELVINHLASAIPSNSLGQRATAFH